MAATKRLYSLLANNIGKALANDNPNILAVMCQCLKADNPKRFNEPFAGEIGFQSVSTKPSSLARCAQRLRQSKPAQD